MSWSDFGAFDAKHDLEVWACRARRTDRIVLVVAQLSHGAREIAAVHLGVDPYAVETTRLVRRGDDVIGHRVMPRRTIVLRKSNGGVLAFESCWRMSVEEILAGRGLVPYSRVGRERLAQRFRAEPVIIDGERFNGRIVPVSVKK